MGGGGMGGGAAEPLSHSETTKHRERATLTAREGGVVPLRWTSTLWPPVRSSRQPGQHSGQTRKVRRGQRMGGRFSPLPFP